jgi:hypothetical protein
MTTFAEFNEAAKLYAKYTPVVDELRKAFEAETERFFEALSQWIKSKVSILRLGQEQSAKLHMWYLEADTDNPEVKVPYVWLVRNDSRLVENRRLRIGIHWDNAPAAMKHTINTKIASLSFPPNCTRDSFSGWFASNITLDQDPIRAVGEPILLLLECIRASYVASMGAKEGS